MPDLQAPVDKKYKPDDAHMSRELAEQWRDDYAFFRDSWHMWNAGYWQTLEFEEMQRFIRDYMVGVRERGKKVNTADLRSLEKMYRLDCFVRQEKIDIEDKYLNLRNGLLNLETFELEEHRRDVYFTWQLDFDYDPKAKAPTFMRYLETTFTDIDHEPNVQVIKLVVEALGYSLTADTSLKASFWLYGASNSGKSTLITLLRNMLGNMHTTIDLNQLATNKFMLAKLAGKRVVTCTEAAVGHFLPDAIYKILVGGTDEIFADVKNKTAVSFVPRTKAWWAMNEMPRTVDRSGAILNRIHVIPFTRAIPVELRDTNLDGKLFAERSGILNVMLRGLKTLRAEGNHFILPEVSKAIREEYRMMNDTEANFINECFHRNPEMQYASSALYSDYKHYCQDNGYSPKNIRQVAKEWERLGLTKVELHTGNFWKGIAPKKANEIF